MGSVFKNMPACRVCCGADCSLLKSADFSSLESIQGEWTKRSGDWSDVTGSSGEMDFTASGVELLANAEPNVAPYGVQFTTQFRGRVGSVVRFFAGADADVSVSAEVTLGADCGQLRFYQQSLSGETRVGDIHWIREMRGEQWHTCKICYDPKNKFLTATITTQAGETWAYTAPVTATGSAGYGLGSNVDTVEFRGFSSSATISLDVDGNTIQCPSCSPSCSLAWSPFSSSFSDCDWEVGTYTLSDSGASGTGMLRHRTEIWTVPYVAQAIVEGLTDDNLGNQFTLYCDSIPVTCVVTKVNGFYYLTLTVNGVNAGTVGVGDSPVPRLVLRACRYSGAVMGSAGRYLENADIKKVELCASQQYPCKVSFSTNSGIPVLLSDLTALRHTTTWSGCRGCVVCDSCDPSHFPADLLWLDFGPAGFLAPRDGLCSGCASIGGVYSLAYYPPGYGQYSCMWVSTFDLCDCGDKQWFFNYAPTPDQGFRCYCNNPGATDGCPTDWAGPSVVLRLILDPYSNPGLGVRLILSMYLVPSIVGHVGQTNVYHLSAVWMSEYFANDQCDRVRTLNFISDSGDIGGSPPTNLKICTGNWPNVTIHPLTPP